MDNSIVITDMNSTALVQLLPSSNDDTKLNESVEVLVNGTTKLTLSLLLKEEELAPLFSGAAWAGTVVWDAAIYLARYFLHHYGAILRDKLRSIRVLELGAGIGVPGMAARIAGAESVILTEQEDLVDLMHRNLKGNANALGLDAANDKKEQAIVGRVLSWGKESIHNYLMTYQDEQIDFVLSCDCIFVPLYGDSWKALAITMQAICETNPQCCVFLSVERRKEDGVDSFLEYIASRTILISKLLEKSIASAENLLEIYQLNLQET
uniref:Uncharacterized protein AlNc14C546G12115 n=1 Tax=Albugo laibachii Nc14 TaxID=890382 RepID=F0X125_9STRA|nr:conserved hypothetical protein [Albugo laibachii Nc14]|eukprot:CCA27477.1 conserved hypothetical protein [Albugo laibachii Nc14]